MNMRLKSLCLFAVVGVWTVISAAACDPTFRFDAAMFYPDAAENVDGGVDDVVAIDAYLADVALADGALADTRSDDSRVDDAGVDDAGVGLAISSARIADNRSRSMSSSTGRWISTPQVSHRRAAPCWAKTL
jgi:hypothetical protein